MAAYYAIICKDEGNASYGLFVHDMPCYTNADTLEELTTKATKALKMYVETSREQGITLPDAAGFNEVYEKHKDGEGFYGITLVAA